MLLSGDITKSQTFDPTKSTSCNTKKNKLTFSKKVVKEMYFRQEKFEVFLEPITTNVENSVDQIKLQKSDGFIFVYNQKSEKSFEEIENYIKVVERAKDEEQFAGLMIATLNSEEKDEEIKVKPMVVELKYQSFIHCEVEIQKNKLNKSDYELEESMQKLLIQMTYINKPKTNKRKSNNFLISTSTDSLDDILK